MSNGENKKYFIETVSSRCLIGSPISWNAGSHICSVFLHSSSPFQGNKVVAKMFLGLAMFWWSSRSAIFYFTSNCVLQSCWMMWALNQLLAVCFCSLLRYSQLSPIRRHFKDTSWPLLGILQKHYRHLNALTAASPNTTNLGVFVNNLPSESTIESRWTKFVNGS